MEESRTDIIRGKLDHKQIEDVEELMYDLITALEKIEELATETDIIRPEHLLAIMDENLKDHLKEPKTCQHQTYRQTLEEQAEYCEEFAIAGSDYCKRHD